MADTIRIECRGADTLPLDALEEFQGNLKKRGKKEIEQVITSIDKYGIYWPESNASSPVTAIEATIVHRSYDAGKIKQILCSSKYRACGTRIKIEIAKTHFGQFIGKSDNVLDYVIKGRGIDGAKNKYRKLVEQSEADYHG